MLVLGFGIRSHSVAQSGLEVFRVSLPSIEIVHQFTISGSLKLFEICQVVSTCFFTATVFVIETSGSWMHGFLLMSPLSVGKELLLQLLGEQVEVC